MSSLLKATGRFLRQVSLPLGRRPLKCEHSSTHGRREWWIAAPRGGHQNLVWRLSGIGGTTALRFASDTFRVSESAGTTVVGVSRVGSGDAAIEASYATADETAVSGSDYVAASGTVTLAAGETAQSITVSLVDDGVTEADETFRVTLTGAAVCGGAPATARVLVADDDVPAVILLTPVGLAAAGGGVLLLRRRARTTLCSASKAIQIQASRRPT